MQPDEDTKLRIKNLAKVGKALDEISNDNGGETDYFLAQTALGEFEEGRNKLTLDEESKEGMTSLINYLRKKISKRMTQEENAA